MGVPDVLKADIAEYGHEFARTPNIAMRFEIYAIPLISVELTLCQSSLFTPWMK